MVLVAGTDSNRWVIAKYTKIISFFAKNTLHMTDSHPGVCEGENELEVQTFDLWEDFSSFSGYPNQSVYLTLTAVHWRLEAYFNVKPANKTKI